MFVHSISETISVQLLEKRHAEQFYRLVCQNYDRLAEWCPWLDRVNSIESTRDFLRDKIARFADSNGFTAGIFEQRRLIGVIALEYVDETNSTTEIGYWIDSAFQGRGIVIQACRSVMQYAFDELDLGRIQIRCATENVRSRAIPEKLGFKKEGTIRQCERLRDRAVDLVIYGILADEWAKPGPH